MANEVSGNASVMKFDTLAGATYVECADQLDCTLTFDLDALEVTNKSHSNVRDYIAGNRGWSGTLTGHISSQAAGDTDGQVLIQTSVNTGVKMDFQFYESGTADTFTGDILITSFSKSYPQNAPATFTANFVGCGALTIA